MHRLQNIWIICAHYRRYLWLTTGGVYNNNITSNIFPVYDDTIKTSKFPSMLSEITRCLNSSCTFSAIHLSVWLFIETNKNYSTQYHATVRGRSWQNLGLKIFRCSFQLIATPKAEHSTNNRRHIARLVFVFVPDESSWVPYKVIISVFSAWSTTIRRDHAAHPLFPVASSDFPLSLF